MNLRSDDDIYRARLVWLGPAGYTFPIHLPYAQWGLWFLLTGVFSAILVPLTGTWASTGMAIAMSLIATHFIWRHVDPDRPVRKVMAVALLDRVQVKPPKQNLRRLSGSHIRVHEQITGDR